MFQEGLLAFQIEFRPRPRFIAFTYKELGLDCVKT